MGLLKISLFISYKADVAVFSPFHNNLIEKPFLFFVFDVESGGNSYGFLQGGVHDTWWAPSLYRVFGINKHFGQIQAFLLMVISI